MKYSPWNVGLISLHDVGKIRVFCSARGFFWGLFCFVQSVGPPDFQGHRGAHVAFIWCMYVYAYFSTSVSVDLSFVKS